MNPPAVPHKPRRWIWLVALTILAVAVAASVMSTPHRITQEEFERKDREQFKEFYAQKDAREKADAAKLSAAREARIKAFMKHNPSWTRPEAERHIQVEDYDYSAARTQEGSTKSLNQVCSIIHLELDNKPIGRLSTNEIRQMKVCESLGF